ncbi:tRNA cytosine(34) acetyltransferase [hydrothermal vent metagenome]|uniref:tRNA cytosine(34) acetyltransferase n=1 Tax=hydrothermal vent metagenome TaxID=652676 RepID=A0A3B0WTV1_9ZZZZ
MLLFDLITSFIKSQEINLKKSQQRMAVVCHVNNSQEELTSFVKRLWHKRKLVISPTIESALDPRLARSKLGEEFDLLVFDARESFEPDALGAVSGVLCGGGCLVVLLPDENSWHSGKSLFNRHIHSLLNNEESVFYFKGDGNLSECSDIEKDNSENKFTNFFPYRTEDQKKAVEKIVDLIQLNNECCCVLTSGRGRGKSSALGFVSAQLIEKNDITIVISAPKLSVANPMFKHLQEQCSNGSYSRAKFKYKKSQIKFVAPDLLLDTLPFADVLLIDEAAAIPLSMLERLLHHYKKIIFSTTTHGYEGTGRGFVFKFYNMLCGLKPSWKKIELHQPIRWAVNDPLEKWIEKLLFLNLKLSEDPEKPQSVSQCKIELIERTELLKNKTKITDVFSLLVFAHYRTSPSDFKYILDDEKVRLYVLQYENKTLGVVVINQEGEFSSELSSAVYKGERRPKGHLLAQTLCFHGGSEQAARLKYSRVMRIAIHPECQLNGLGSFLLQQVIEKEEALGVDIIGSSFSATTVLLDFWHKAGLSLLRLGFSKDHVSAAHSAVMAKALTASGEKIITNLAFKFNLNINLWLQGPLVELSEEIKSHRLLHQAHSKSINIKQNDLDDVISFAKYNRNYEVCMPAITRYIKNQLSLGSELNEQQKQIINLSLKYMNNWNAVVDEIKADVKSVNNINSKSQAVSFLRLTLAAMLKIY